MVQSFSILTYFVSGAFHKSASTIVANLVGAKMLHLTNKMLKSAFIIHGYFFAVYLFVVVFFGDLCLSMFSSAEHAELLSSPQFKQLFMTSMILLAFHFLIDGWVWILVGCLTGTGDTKYILVVSALVHWIAYLIPTIWFIGYQKGGADVAWGIVVAMSALNLALYAWRYFSGAWINNSIVQASDQKILPAV